MKTLFRSLGVFALFALVAATLSGCSGGSGGNTDNTPRANFTFFNVNGANTNTSNFSVRGEFDPPGDGGVDALAGNNYSEVVVTTPGKTRIAGIYFYETNFLAAPVGTTVQLADGGDVEFYYGVDDYDDYWVATSGTATLVSRNANLLQIRIRNATMVADTPGAAGTFSLDTTLFLNPQTTRIVSVGGTRAKGGPAKN